MKTMWVLWKRCEFYENDVSIMKNDVNIMKNDVSIMDQMMRWWCGPLRAPSPVDLHPFLVELSNPLLLYFSSCTSFRSQSHNWGRPLLGRAHSQVSEAAKVPLGHLSTSRSPASSLVARRSFTAGNHLSLLFLQSIHGLPVKLKPRHSPAFWPGGGCVCLFAVPEVPECTLGLSTTQKALWCTATLWRAYTEIQE